MRPVLFGPSGHVDDASKRVDAALAEEPQAVIDGAGDRGREDAADRGLRQAAGEGESALRPVDHGPRQDDLLLGRAGPFHVDDGDPPEHPSMNCVVDGG